MGRGWICGSAIDPCHLRRSGHRKHDPVTTRSVGLDSVTDCRERSYGRAASFQARCSAASVGCYGASVDRFEGRNRRLEAPKGALKLRFVDFNLQKVVLKLQDIVLNLQNARLRPQNSLLELRNALLSAPHLDLAFDSVAAHRWRHHNHDICLGEVGQGRSKLALERPLSH